MRAPTAVFYSLFLFACASHPSAGPDDAAASDVTVAKDQESPDAAALSDAGDAGTGPAVTRRPFPNVPNVGGKTLVSASLVTIVASNDDPSLQSLLPSFSDAFASSQLWSQVSAEYSLGTIRSSGHVVGPAMTGTYTTAELVAYVSALIGANLAPGPDGSTVYLVYLPSGASYGPPYGTTTCGYHTS